MSLVVTDLAYVFTARGRTDAGSPDVVALASVVTEGPTGYARSLDATVLDYAHIRGRGENVKNPIVAALPFAGMKNERPIAANVTIACVILKLVISKATNSQALKRCRSTCKGVISTIPKL
jgi:hypothetical protein